MVRDGTTQFTLGLTTNEHGRNAEDQLRRAEGQLRGAAKRLERGSCDLAAQVLAYGRFYQGLYEAHRQSIRRGRDRDLSRRLKQSEQAVKACYATRPPSSLPRESQLVLLDSIMENAKTEEERNAALIHARRIRRYKMR